MPKPSSPADRLRDRRRHAAIAAGTWLSNVPAGRVQQHIDRLNTAGMSNRHIAVTAGVSERAVRNARQQTYVQGRTAAAILAVQPARTERKLRAGLVSSLPASRRIRALAALGWSMTEQGKQAGMCLQQMWEIASLRKAHITGETHTRVCDLFERLCDKPGPSDRARRCATRKGWLPPLDLDDSLEFPAEPADPDEEVDDILVDRVLAGERAELNDAELITAVKVATEKRGMPVTAVADLLSLRHSHVKLLQAGQLPPARAKRAAKRLEQVAA
jgi:hypothetical protein